MTTKNTIVASISALAASVMLYYIWLENKAIGLTEKNNRSVSFSTSYCLSGLSGMSISLPAIDQAFYSPSDLTAIAGRVTAIRASYGMIIDNIAAITRVSSSIITSFIFIESNGQPSLTNGYATGLMQIGSNSATDIVYMEYKKGRLGTGETAILQKYLGARLNGIMAMKSPGLAQYISASDLMIPELNILIGAMFLGQLMDESIQSDGQLRMDKVVVRYNSGYYAYSRGKDLPASISDTIAKVNSITGQYIVKLIGKNGVLEMIEAQHCGS